MFKFTGFTEKANKSLNAAVKAAEDLGHTYIGSEHILLGLLSDTSTVAGAVLAAHNITYADIEEELKRSIGVGVPTELQPDDFTPRSKNILETSVAFARQMGQQLVGTEHVLLAIAREGSCSATLLLSRAGVSMQDIVNDVSKALMGGTANAGTDNKDGGKENESMLSQFGRDLTKLAKDGKIDPVIGRQKEIERVIQILSRRTKNNPCLIGEPGVGKTAIAEGLALKIVSGEVPELLKDKKIYSLDLTGMVAGTKYRGDFEERIKKVIDEVKNAKDVILFIDEVHTLIGAGSAEGAVDAANIIKPALGRGEIQIIGATTLNEYRKYIEKDAALERRFQPVHVGEPTTEETLAILHGLRERYEKHHQLHITDEALEAAVTLSDRYIADRYLPDKAIDLMDEACSRVRIQAYTAPPDVRKQELALEKVLADKKEAIAHQDYETAARLRDEERSLKAEIDQKREAWNEGKPKVELSVSEDDVAAIVSGWTGIPVTKMTQSEKERLLHLEDVLHARVIGQDEAISAISRAIRRARAGLKDPKRPIGSFIFLGPTGVGKTELCRALGEAMFGDESAVIRVDMSEYMEKHTTSRLVGSPPGYVGYEEGGQLTEAVRRKPYSVVLLDEVEKAHPDVFNILLQILEDGRLTDNTGRTVSFKNTIIVMTSNAGAHDIGEGRAMGFGSKALADATNYNAMKDAVMKAVKDVFRPEFINRVDELIVFHPLTEVEIRAIAGMMLGQVASRLKERAIALTWDDEVVEKLAREGYDVKFGARPLRRLIQRTVEDTLSEELLGGKIALGDRVRLKVADGKITVEKEA